jgi:hypothetical protein
MKKPYLSMATPALMLSLASLTLPPVGDLLPTVLERLTAD